MSHETGRKPLVAYVNGERFVVGHVEPGPDGSKAAIFDMSRLKLIGEMITSKDVALTATEDGMMIPIIEKDTEVEILIAGADG